MRRIAFILAMLALGGALVGLMAQERREPWPPRPIVPPDSEEQQEPPQPKLPIPAPVTPPPLAHDLPAVPKLDPAPPAPAAPLLAAAPSPDVIPPPGPTPVAPPMPAAPVISTPRTDVIPPPGPPPVAPPMPAVPPMPAAPVVPEIPAVPDDVIPPPGPTPAPAPTPAATPLAAPKLPRVDDPPPPAAPLTLTEPKAKSGTLTPPAPVVPLDEPGKGFELPKTAAPVVDPIPPCASSPTDVLPFRILKPLHRTHSSDPALPHHSAIRPAATVGGTVVIEKRGPAHAKHTDAIPYTIIVRNPTSGPIHHVRIEDEIPAPARIVRCVPEPILVNGKPVWHFPVLAAGEEKQISVVLQVSLPGELETVARAFAPVGSSVIRTQIHPGAFPAGAAPPVTPGAATPAAFPGPAPTGAAPVGIAAVARDVLTLQVKCPPTAAVGAMVTFDLLLHNTSGSPLESVSINAEMSGGLKYEIKGPDGRMHDEGPVINATLDSLAPGARKTINLSLQATKLGLQVLEVQIQSANGQKATAKAQVMIGETALRLKQPSETKLTANRDGELTIDVGNFQAQGVRNLVVVDALPEGVEFVAASERGLYRAESRSVHWLVDYLPPGENKTLKVKVRAKRAGDFANVVTARTEGRDEGRTSATLRVTAHAELAVDLKKRDDALEIGKETVYEIQVHNLGSTPATGVQLAAAVPEGMAAHRAEGPTAFRVEGRSLVFQPVRALAPGEKARFVVGMTAQVAGDQRVRVQVASDQGTTPIVREERLLVYADR